MIYDYTERRHCIYLIVDILLMKALFDLRRSISSDSDSDETDTDVETEEI